MEGWDHHVVARDMAAWSHFQHVLRHGPDYLADARRAARRLNPDADTRRSWTYHLRALASALDSARHQAATWPTPAQPGPEADRSREDLAAETWHEMNVWAEHGPVAVDILRRATNLSPARTGRRSAATNHSHTPTGPVPPLTAAPTASAPGNAAESSRRPQHP
ncbi:hypothetical protein ABZW30_08070 [Kitasatospora sp. NPDC004669]|uniref:hypothetical protein n=1 Tax=Kitasatospora sp. NPDC004669 TaxID=3154555 RepID=UPI0033AE14A5